MTDESTQSSDEVERIRAVYAQRDRAKGDLYAWHQPDVRLADADLQHSLARRLRVAFGTDLSSLRALDVGCGAGAFLRLLISWGADPSKMVGTELLADRIAVARHRSPAAIRWVHGTLDSLNSDEEFDLVSAFTVFSSILDPTEQQRLANAMWKRVAQGGGVLLFDFRVDNPRNRDVRGLRLPRINELFPEAETIVADRLILAPPIARRVARFGPLVAGTLRAIPHLRTHQLAWVPHP